MENEIVSNIEHYCERCGKLLDNVIWLELDMETGKYHEDGFVAEDKSQGCFPFGPDCAAAVLKAGGKLKRIGAAAR